MTRTLSMPAPTPKPPESGSSPPSEDGRNGARLRAESPGAAPAPVTEAASGRGDAPKGVPPADASSRAPEPALRAAPSLPAAGGSLMLIGVGESVGRLLASVRPMENVALVRLQTSGAGPGVFSLPLVPVPELLDRCPFLEDLGLTEKTFDLELRCCAKALYLIHRAALLDRLRDEMKARPIGTVVIVAEAASSLGSTVLSELPADLEALYARRLGRAPVILRIPIFPAGNGGELERTTLYALGRELDAHYRGSFDESAPPACEDPHDELLLADFQVGTPAQRKDELVRFLGTLATFFRSPGGVAGDENPVVQHRTNGPWRRSYRDLAALWRGSSWTDFRRRRLLRELEQEGRPPPLVDQEPFRAGRRLYLEMDAKYRRLLAASPYDYPARISPDDAGSLVELAEQLIGDGRDRDAYDAYAAAAETRADMTEAFEGLGRAALLLQNGDEALKHFTHALQLDPCSRAGHEGIILCYLAAGRRDMAQRHLVLASAAGCVVAPELARRLT
ncbi:MAG: hypothetical protein HY303_03595, partial [Candidatus Wallbacteria bacterium]|nr:hypothetical protein [Candidatus Wallbacteria bacterium]